MSIESLEKMSCDIEDGEVFYACLGSGLNEWHISHNLQDIQLKAQKATDVRRSPVSIYQLVANCDATAGDSFLVVKKVLSVQGRRSGDSTAAFLWMLVDTKEAAETLRDVSFGPTPFFAAKLIQTVKPSKN